MEAPFILKLLASCVSISEHAGNVIRKIMSSGKLGIIEKGINDLQTQADRESQACIISSLLKHFPDLNVVGEENLSAAEMNLGEIELGQDKTVLQQKCPQSLHSILCKDVTVWVDPLDGTSEFTQNLLGHVTVLIGISMNGSALGGVIHQPYAPPDLKSGRSIWGLKDLGIFGLKSRVIGNGASPDAKSGNVICTTRSHSSPLIDTAIQACQPTQVVRVGGCGHKVLLLMEGEAHAYIFPSPGCKKWDTCAPEAILEICGGKLTDICGKSLRYDSTNLDRANKQGVLATPVSDWHSWYLNKIPSSVTNSLL